MQAAIGQLNLAARSYHSILKSSLTIADLARSDEIHLRIGRGVAISSKVNNGIDQVFLI